MTKILPDKRCNEAIQEIYKLQPKLSWQIKCVKEMPNYFTPDSGYFAAGLTVDKEKTIYIQKGIRDLTSVAIHELGHVYDIEKLNDKKRKEIAHSLGFEKYNVDDYANSPVEQWARGFAYCAGYSKNSLFPAAVPCNTVKKYAPDIKNKH